MIRDIQVTKPEGSDYGVPVITESDQSAWNAALKPEDKEAQSAADSASGGSVFAAFTSAFTNEELAAVMEAHRET